VSEGQTICGPSMLSGAPQYCPESASCSFWDEKTRMCAVRYLIDRLNYNIPVIGNAANTWERFTTGKAKAAMNRGRERAGQPDPGDL
jgi:hypothetical protein